ncbi:hypothetical protein ABUW04_37740 [Streptacidiphilus sp. N1-10]|uniref:Nucleotidyltransferase family protein n=1 Tax=Streptacidiphilus jeojiensis TaxID=3229225 RepID=A0ABV6Y0G3_9ACTN
MDEQIVNRLHEAVRRTAELTSGRVASGRGHDEADDSVGTIGTDDACGFDPFPLLRSLHRAGARAVVIGQVAGILHGSNELTGDLDLLWSGDPAQAGPLVAALSAVGGSLSDDDGAPIALEPGAFLCPKVQFSSPGASGDCCTPALPWGTLTVADYLDRALTATDRDGSEIHYLRREDLISMRRAVGRPKDLRRAAELEAL